jgi:DNA-binding transcriptional MocR family regulator
MAERDIVSAPSLAGQHAADPFLHEPIATIDFCTAALPCLPIIADVASAMTRDEYVRLGELYHGYHPRGLTDLRDRIARVYSDQGLATTADQILVTSGAHQALELIATGCLESGDGVLVEQPTYRGALETFTLAGCRIRSVRCDLGGIDVADVDRELAATPTRLIYVQSAVQNPTGGVLTTDRKRRLARMTEKHGVVLVDDASLDGLQFDCPAPPVAAYGDNDGILTIGSLSKLFWGGLRLGWIRASARTIARLAQVKGFTDLGTSLVSQQIGLHLLDHLPTAREMRRVELRRGLETLTRLLADRLPTWKWQPPQGGASLWVCMPGADSSHYSQVALRYGVAMLPGGAFSQASSSTEYTRLPFALDPKILHAGVHRLARAWEAYTSRDDRIVPIVSART